MNYEYRTTHLQFDTTTLHDLGHDFRTRVPEGDDWVLVSSTSTNDHIFWTWLRPSKERRCESCNDTGITVSPAIGMPHCSDVNKCQCCDRGSVLEHTPAECPGEFSEDSKVCDSCSADRHCENGHVWLPCESSSCPLCESESAPETHSYCDGCDEKIEDGEGVDLGGGVTGCKTCKDEQ